MTALQSGKMLDLYVEIFIREILKLKDGRLRRRRGGPTLDTVLQQAVENDFEHYWYGWLRAYSPLIQDQYLNLIDMFAAPKALRTTRARMVNPNDPTTLWDKYLFPLETGQRRGTGTPSMVDDIDSFKRNWQIFTDGCLGGLREDDWCNMIAAGGSVLACLMPLPQALAASMAERTACENMEEMRKRYYREVCPASDVDLFLWGLTESEAEKKMKRIYEVVKSAIPYDVVCVRTNRTVSIYSQHPFRPIQIILRLYSSPAEVLAGFDVDACCVAYDGNRVWGNPRSTIALMRQCNTIDLRRRNPSYEYRLAKYAERGFEICVPSLRRKDVDPQIYESTDKCSRLKKLLVIEHSRSPSSLVTKGIQPKSTGGVVYVKSRTLTESTISPQPEADPADERVNGNTSTEETAVHVPVVQKNNYDSALFCVPYGPGWDAPKVKEFVCEADAKLSTESGILHHHAAFVGTMEEILEDCCGCCPSMPVNIDEKTRYVNERACIRGRISFWKSEFYKRDTRQMSIDEWSQGVYVRHPDRRRLFGHRSFACKLR